MTTRTLIILDGIGLRRETEANALAAAHTPTLDGLFERYPHSRIATSGLAVGLPEGQMGNSEVGHMNLGAGRVVYQNFTRINQAIADGEFAGNPALTELLDGARRRGGAVHLLGLLSPGGVHSHSEQIMAACRVLAARGIERFYVHAFLDGRDTPPRSAQADIAALEAELASLGRGRIASLVGRYYAMDRDNRWERIEAAHGLIVEGRAEHQAASAELGLAAAYARGESDEFVKATAIGEPVRVADEDALVFMNFRPDRARQLCQALVDPAFAGFARPRALAKQRLLTLTRYSDRLDGPCAFPPERLSNSLGEYLAGLGKTQLRIAETEKYAHVTFFFNGGREQPFAGEQRILVASPDVASYDLQPQMSAPELTGRLVEAIGSRAYDLIVCNYANGDMVGHTGSFAAAVEAVEALDRCLARVVEATLAAGGECLITADHGNVEQMCDADSGQAHTAHTLNPVPLILVGGRAGQFELADGRLCDIAPTLLQLMGLVRPAEMSGVSLLR
ncbi:2,3-bisphosphoglycerate-independent phosphoglycerate mutase [Pseudomonas lalucatii]|uniref:2,3-bisphosphoglycerate-independent phosphoglycerate mutase n=1 Tax=Pseudomonas lalucatii TaxID=1424203 RepID=A0ABS5PYB1_9PSED|nr:2,3-bisphosphoglycerate-independent phosphoglycerate mutase [Pseudomonas lalucatii]MBS7660869.1 2,3-bisphosphoglycerate-independent phosphoglycerate mutase [Pseudomonas lalucatii]QVM87609.1 2,3-bisphosphoglycerate-independent phosphoglycerate mutase [Pseudomonas lalucatii]